MEIVVWGFLLSLLFSLFAGPLLIPVLVRLKFGQSIRSDGPARHMKKSGTPTMGGLIFLGSLTITTLLLSKRSPEVLILLGITLIYGFIGFLDDFIKIAMKRPLGLKAREKLTGQILFALIFGFLAIVYLNRGTELIVPLTNIKITLSPFLFLVFLTLLMVFTTNAVNLTDGLDGLAAGVTVITSLAYTFTALMMGKMEVALFMAVLAGSCLGFLAFNRYPARVFMGDTGSLALGGAIGGAAVLTGTELLLPLLGGIFVIEAFSVIIQVIYFRFTGKRIFLMSPLHHHYELKGWHERKVVRTFWFAALIFALMGILGLYNAG